MHTTLIPPSIVFTLEDIPSKEIPNHHDPLMVAVSIIKATICHTLIDNGYGLNTCSIGILNAMNVDLSIVQPDETSILVFHNIDKNTLDIIMLPIKAGPVILDTLIHVIL